MFFFFDRIYDMAAKVSHFVSEVAFRDNFLPKSPHKYIVYGIRLLWTSSYR